MIKKKNGKIFVAWIIATIVVSMPLFFRGVEGHFGQDLGFHLNRIEGLYVALKAGEFPVKMESYWMNGYGYPVSIYYGDLWLYFPAFLRILGVPVVGAYKSYIFVINGLTLLTTYLLAKEATNHEKIAICASIVYTFSYYRLVNVYIRAAVGEYTAMMFFPVVALALYRMYANKEEKVFQNAFLLATGMTGIMSAHLLSSEIVAIVMMCVAILFIKKTLSKNMIFTYILAVIESILFNLYFLVSFLDCYRNVNVNINGISEKSREIQTAGVTLKKLFSFFEVPYGNVVWKEQIGLNIGPVLMVCIGIGCVLCILRKIKKGELMMLIMAIATLFASTRYFPWDKIRNVKYIGNILAQIQFPWRYLGVATLFAMLLFLFLMLRVPKKYVATVVCVLMIISAGMMMYFTKDYNRYAEYKTFQQTKDLDSYDMGFCEYLRTGTNREKFTNTIENSEGVLYADVVERQGNAMTVQVQVAETGGYIELPIINFKGYECVDENDNPLPIVDGANNLIRISFADEYQGNIYINYVQPMYWCMAEWVSLFTYLAFLVGQIYFKKHPKAL